MSRLPLVDPATMTPQQRSQYDRFPSNLTRALLLTEHPLSTALPNLANALRAATLDAIQREAVILRVASLSGSAYERMQHLGEARKAGWSDDDIEAIEGGRPPDRVANLLAFVDEVVRSGDATDEAFVKVQETMAAGDIATVLLLIGHYMMVARFVTVLRVELDPQPGDWSHEH